ncbi:MAG: pyridoxal phosphate-dependent aminotransferase [Rhizobiaceae bacterium]|nr:pyridoxal phosphate-dependent aminotransferase [Rhizobiaceae bacterium]
MNKYPLTTVVEKLPATVPFVGPETQERQSKIPFKTRLGANENVFGPSPKAIAAMKNVLDDIWMYGDSENHDLRQALAKFHGIGYENIVVGEGIDALLGYTCRMFVEPGTKVVTSKGAYPTFNYHVSGNGGELHFAPFEGDHENPQALLELANARGAVLIYFSNPNNPMGSWHNADVVQNLIDNIRPGTILVLDEAYIEMAPEGVAPKFDVSNPGVLRFRTFSKAYGMAGARIGYCIGEAGLIAQMEKVRNHFGVNRIAQAGALAALEDQDYLQQTIAEITTARDEIGRIATKHGLSVLPSAANFVAIDCAKDGEYTLSLANYMSQKGVFIRRPGIAPQSRCIRVSAGRAGDLLRFDKVLGDALAAV